MIEPTTYRDQIDPAPGAGGVGAPFGGPATARVRLADAQRLCGCSTPVAPKAASLPGRGAAART